MGGDVRTNRTRHGSNQSRGLVPAWLVGPVGVLLVAALAAGLLVATADEAAAHGLPGDHVGTPASAPIRFRQGIEAPFGKADLPAGFRSEEHTSELQSLMRISYAVFCLKKKTNNNP